MGFLSQKMIICLFCRDQTTKWMTTGSFPQEVIVQLATTSSISRVKTWSTNGILNVIAVL
jgi:hypothetical protein